MVVTDLANSLFVDAAREPEDGAQLESMTLLLADSDNALYREATYLDLFNRPRFAGILLAPFESSTDDLDRVRGHGRPVN